VADAGDSAEEVFELDSQMAPLIGAICGRHEDLALQLLTLSGQDIQIDLNRRLDLDRTILVCGVRADACGEGTRAARR